MGRASRHKKEKRQCLSGRGVDLVIHDELVDGGLPETPEQKEMRRRRVGLRHRIHYAVRNLE